MLNSAARWLATTAARFPERIGVEDEWGTMTWRELETAVERVSTAMLELGVERNQIYGALPRAVLFYRFEEPVFVRISDLNDVVRVLSP